MKYRHVQLVRRSIRASVAWEVELVLVVAKRGTKLKIVQREIEFKELEHWLQPHFSKLQLEGEIINHGKAELLHLY